jgi:signal transduction histidine kinase
MRRRALLAAALLLAAAPGLAADQRPTPEQVRALTLKAAALVAAQGTDKAREAFHRDGEFRFGEIYVNVIDGNGTWLVYPPNPRNEGKSVLNARDAGGKLLVQEIIRVAGETGEGWVEYQWLNPASNRIEPKMSYVRSVPERGAIVYIGLYR